MTDNSGRLILEGDAFGPFKIDKPAILLICNPIRAIREGIKFPYPFYLANLGKSSPEFYGKSKEHIIQKGSKELVKILSRAFSLDCPKFSLAVLNAFEEVTDLSEPSLYVKRELSAMLGMI